MTSGTGVTAPLHENAKFRWTESELPESRPGSNPGGPTGLGVLRCSWPKRKYPACLLVAPTKGGAREKGAPPASPGNADEHPGYPKYTRRNPGRGRMKEMQVCTASGAAAAVGAIGSAVPMAVPRARRWPWQLNYDAAAAWLPESSSCVGERATQTGGGRLRKRARTSSGSSGVGGEGCSGRLGWAVGSRAAPGSAPAAQLAG